MGFKETNNQNTIDALEQLSRIISIDADDFLQSWADHQEAVQAAEEEAEEFEAIEEEAEVVDLSTLSLVDKLGEVLHSTLNDIIVGRLVIEDGAELLATTQAVTLREQLRVALAKDGA